MLKIFDKKNCYFLVHGKCIFKVNLLNIKSQIEKKYVFQVYRLKIGKFDQNEIQGIYNQEKRENQEVEFSFQEKMKKFSKVFRNL